MTKPLKQLLTLALALCLLLPGAALANPADRGVTDQPATVAEALAWAVNGEYRSLTWDARAASLTVLTAVTEDDLADHAAATGTKLSRVRYAWYGALVTCLRAQYEQMGEPLTGAAETIELLLSDDDRRERDRNALYRSLTDGDKASLAAACGLPVGFVQFIAANDDWDDHLADRWYDEDWYDPTERYGRDDDWDDRWDDDDDWDDDDWWDD